MRIIVRAEIRMANEIDAGQERGEVAKPNQPVTRYVRSADIPAKLEDLGVSRQRLSEWRDVRDAGEQVVERCRWC